MLYTVGKNFLRAIIYCPNSLGEIWFEKIWASKVLGQQESQFWDSHKKMTFGCNPRVEAQNIL
jgi:hypothetical protein